MTMTDSCSGRDYLVSSLILFACSAKLWLTLNANANENASTNQERDCSRGGPSKNDDVGRVEKGSARWTPSSSSSRQRRRPQRMSYTQHPWPILCHAKTKTSNDYDVEEGEVKVKASDTEICNDKFVKLKKENEEVTDNRKKSPVKARCKKRSMSEEERSLLMERISLSDMVLTRETSSDFHPKNSNWSHFENYGPPNHISTPKKEVIVEESEKEDENENGSDEEEEEFLWSEPPALNIHTDDIHNDSATYATSQSRYTNKSMQRNPYGRKSSSEHILHFNSNCLPSKLIMVRHGQSEGNVDELLYATKPDNALRLTELGWEMARMAGKALKNELPPNETVHFIVSPYARTVETFHGIVSAWSDPEDFAHVPDRSKRLKLWYTKLMEMGLTWHEDPRIREQDFGNYQDPQVVKKAKAERHKFGSFYYRFAHGESASDVFDRVSTFLDSLWRSFESGRAQNYVLVGHGISIRVFLARYFRYSIDQFHMLANPKNCEMVMLAHDGLGRLKLDGRCELELSEVQAESEDVDPKDGENGEKNNKSSVDGKGAQVNGKEDGVQKKTQATTTVVTGYKKHLRLRTLPPQYVRPRTVRMCYNDTC